MKVPPLKPHFFKPLLPGFKHALKIPVSFLKYLQGHDHIEHAILKRAGNKWLVKLNGQKLKEGWGKFAEENDLQLGDLLIFRHEGEMEFEVTIFNVSHCDREYAEFLQQEEKEAHIVEETSKNFIIKDKTNPSTVEETSNNSEFKEVAPHNPIGPSYFECTIRPYCISKGYLRLPKQFSMANGLINKNCGLIIRDQRQRSWNLRLATYSSVVYILGGWNEFLVANDLKEGDYMMFEVVANGEKPIWKFHEKPKASIKSSIKASFHAKAAVHKPFGHSRFVCTIRPYCLTYGYLCLPKQFALENGLIDKKCDLIIRDERERPWNLILRPFGDSVCIRGGWHKFRDTYCLKEGDRIMFEVVTDGEKPIWKFHGKASGEDVSNIEQ